MTGVNGVCVDSWATAVDGDVVLNAVKHIVPTATSYNVIYSNSVDGSETNQEVAKRLSGEHHELTGLFQDGNA